MQKNILAFALLTIFAFCNMTAFANFSQPYTPPKTETNPNLKGYTLFIPANTTLEAVLSGEIDSNSATVGANVELILTDDFKYGKNLVAQAGSVLLGNIVSIKKEKAIFLIQINFSVIRTPYNNLIPINAQIANSENLLMGERILIPANTMLKVIFSQPITLGAQ